MIVVTLLEPSLAGLRTAIAETDAVADAFEIRLDALGQTPPPAEIRRLTRKPLIATCRRWNEGGTWRGPDDGRLALLAECAKAGFEHVDVEDETVVDAPPERLVRSLHDFTSTHPADEAATRLERLAATADVVKLATRVRGLNDVIELLATARALQTKALRFAVMGLGEFPRPLTHLLGARFLYGGGRRTAPYQPDARSIAATLAHWGSPGPAAELYLVVGDPVAHSLSPRMHNAAFDAGGLDAAYGALEMGNRRDLQALLRAAGRLGLKGLSVTAPLKEAAYEVADERTPEAETAKSVNTIRIDDGRIVSHNTDGLGARALVEARFPKAVHGGSILVLGAGGAARGLIPHLQGGRITVANRSTKRRKTLAAEFSVALESIGQARDALDAFDLVVNATSVQEPIPLDGYAGALFDLQYADAPTAWQRHATKTGNAFAGGRDLLLAQGREAFTFWTGKPAPVDAMAKALGVAA